MGSRKARVASFVTSRAFVLLGIVLLAVRFIAPTLSAGLAVAGVDTTGLDGVFEVYAGVLPAVLFAFTALLVGTRPDAFGMDRWLLLAILLTAVVVVQWAGQLDASLRVVTGPFVGAILDGTVAAAILTYFAHLNRRIVRAGVSALAKDGFRALGVGYALAYAFHAFRLIDYEFTFGVPIPSGLLWLFDYGPTVVLSFLSVYFWLELAAWPARASGAWASAIGPPIVVAMLGLAAAGGLGGFLMSNALAWGGSYLVFTPTEVSLAIVGFAIGAFLATALALLRRLPRRTWRLVVGGVIMAAFAGILSFGGALPSLAGIVLGLAFVARGLADRASPTTRDPSDN